MHAYSTQALLHSRYYIAIRVGSYMHLLCSCCNICHVLHNVYQSCPSMELHGAFDVGLTSMDRNTLDVRLM